jgi:hypothetical protein
VEVLAGELALAGHTKFVLFVAMVMTMTASS